MTTYLANPWPSPVDEKEDAVTHSTTYSYEIYILAPAEKVWEAITTGEMTEQYYYGSPVESSWEPEAEFAYLTSDRAGRLAEGRVLEATPNQRLALSLQLLYAPDAAAESPTNQVWEIQDLGGLSKLTVTHDAMAADSATYREISSGVPFILSALKSLLECGKQFPMQE
jgi:uncharacterized protein YndB with AHSA1/START domain